MWNVSNDTFSLSIPEGLDTITMTLRQDATGQTEPITGTFTPLSHCDLSWIDGVVCSSVYRRWNSVTPNSASHPKIVRGSQG
jgi:hypothetical protein